MNAHRLTPPEQLRYLGAFTPETAEHLLDCWGIAERVQDPDEVLGDIAAGFPEEDALDPVLHRLRALHKWMRPSGNRDEVAAILADLTEAAGELRRAAEFGAEELRKARQRLAGASDT